ncbi:MAG: MATE family efflux transporter [Tissierellia bacterium]|nr:MATE family efflux transporter [Tissierellia bacterium]
MERDLTRGNPLNLILGLAVPQVLGAILQLLYNTVDALVVGNFVGEAALAGVGLSAPITFLMNSVMFGLGAGVSIAVGQYFGAREYEDMREAIGTAVVSLVPLTIIISILAFFATDPMLRLINTPPEAFQHASDYLKIIFTGTIFMLMYNLYSSVLRAVGDARSPLLFLGIAATINIVLDLLFVIVFNMGTAGAAYATVASQGLSSLFCLLYIKRKLPLISLQKDEYKFKKEKFKLIMRFGVPSSIQMSIISLGNMAVQNLLNGYGVQAVAGFTAGIRIDSFIVMPYMNVGIALANYTGQNMGAGLYDRVKEGLASAYKILVGISVVTLPIVWLFTTNLVGIFLDSGSSESLDIGVAMLRGLVPLYIFLGLLNNTSGLLRGSGDNMWSLYGSIVSIGTRILGAYLLNPILGISSIWFGQGLGWIVGFVFVYIRFLSGKWKDKGIRKVLDGDL